MLTRGAAAPLTPRSAEIGYRYKNEKLKNPIKTFEKLKNPIKTFEKLKNPIKTFEKLKNPIKK